MAKFTFLRVLGSNLKCAVCKKKDCPVRYYPERRKIQYCDGTRYVTDCEKDRQKHIEKSLKRPLPWYLSTHKMYHPNRVVHFVYAIILYFLLKKYKTYVKLKLNKSNYIKRALLLQLYFFAYLLRNRSIWNQLTDLKVRKFLFYIKFKKFSYHRKEAFFHAWI